MRHRTYVRPGTEEEILRRLWERAEAGRPIGQFFSPFGGGLQYRARVRRGRITIWLTPEFRRALSDPFLVARLVSAPDGLVVHTRISIHPFLAGVNVLATAAWGVCAIISFFGSPLPALRRVMPWLGTEWSWAMALLLLVPLWVIFHITLSTSPYKVDRLKTLADELFDPGGLFTSPPVPPRLPPS